VMVCPAPRSISYVTEDKSCHFSEHCYFHS
jgi:hypothetical protein